MVSSYSIRLEPPIHKAVKNNNIALTKVLLDAGAYSQDNYTNEVCISPLWLAVEQQNYEMIELLCQYHGAEVNGYSRFLTDVYRLIGEKRDMKALKIILPFAAHSEKRTPFEPSDFPKLSLSNIRSLSQIEGAAIDWNVKIIKKVYERDKDQCRRMLQQGCELDVLDYFIEENDFDMFQLALSKHRYVRPRSSYVKVYERGGKWFEAVVNAAESIYEKNNLQYNIERYLDSLKSAGDLEKYEMSREWLIIDL